MLVPFHAKPNQRTACSMDGKMKVGALPAFLSKMKLKWAAESKKTKLENHFSAPGTITEDVAGYYGEWISSAEGYCYNSASWAGFHKNH